IEDVKRLIRSSLGNRAKETLIVNFINTVNLELLEDKAMLIETFYEFAREELKKEAETIIAEEGLKPEEARRYIMSSLKREYATDAGAELNSILPKMSPLNP